MNYGERERLVSGLKRTRISRVWMACRPFTDLSNQDGRTLLAFGLLQRLVSHGEHLTKTCRNGMVRRQLEIGWWPEVTR